MTTQIPSGPYTISLPDDQLLTLQEESRGTPIVILNPIGQPGLQEWHVEPKLDNCVTLKNLKFGKYLGFERREANAFAIASDDPVEIWLKPSPEPFCFAMFVKGSDEDDELYVELSMLRIFPPRVALGPESKLWRFQFLE